MKTFLNLCAEYDIINNIYNDNIYEDNENKINDIFSKLGIDEDHIVIPLEYFELVFNINNITISLLNNQLVYRGTEIKKLVEDCINKKSGSPIFEIIEQEKNKIIDLLKLNKKQASLDVRFLVKNGEVWPPKIRLKFKKMGLGVYLTFDSNYKCIYDSENKTKSILKILTTPLKGEFNTIAKVFNDCMGSEVQPIDDGILFNEIVIKKIGKLNASKLLNRMFKYNPIKLIFNFVKNMFTSGKKLKNEDLANAQIENTEKTAKQKLINKYKK